MKRFEIIAKDFKEERNLSTEAQELIKLLQSKNINHIELIDNEKRTVTLYRKGTQDKNYFVRTKDLPTPEPGNHSIEAPGNSGDNEDKMSELPPVAKSGTGRSVKNKS